LKARAVVLELAGAANVSDRLALIGFCERVLGKVGV
jgi:hypothetical protein